MCQQSKPRTEVRHASLRRPMLIPSLTPFSPCHSCTHTHILHCYHVCWSSRAGLRHSPRRRHLQSICSIAAFLASIHKLCEYSHAALLARLCQAARRAARRLGVTDAALRGARLSFPPVRRLFILANHSVATPGTEIVKDPCRATSDVETCRSFLW